MGNKNTNLQMAKNAKDDEFYTTYETIEKEIAHYVQHFKEKIVLCNCDDPFESNFCRFFLKNFNVLRLKRLICTSFSSSKILGTQISLKDSENEALTKENGYVLDITEICNGQDKLSDEYVTQFLLQSKAIKKLKGDGDFRSEECLRYLSECDIVVTNPPFSLFKEIVAEIVKHKKHFLIIGNQNALTYKEIFPLIQNNQVWTGYQFGEMKFRVPDSSEPRSTRYWVDETGQKWRSLGNAMWLTNLDNDRRHERLNLTKRYNPEEYPKYDDYDAINVRRITDIPYDYPGIMGVPITIINRYNSEQFEIVGEANHGSDNYDAINVRRITDIPYDYPGIMGVPITIINRYNSEQFEIVGEANHGSDNEYDLYPELNEENYPYYKRLYCARCGSRLGRYISHGTVRWICSSYKRKGQAKCPGVRIPDEIIKERGRQNVRESVFPMKL